MQLRRRIRQKILFCVTGKLIIKRILVSQSRTYERWFPGGGKQARLTSHVDFQKTVCSATRAAERFSFPGGGLRMLTKITFWTGARACVCVCACAWHNIRLCTGQQIVSQTENTACRPQWRSEFYFAVPRASNHIGRPKQKLKTSKKKLHLLNFLLFGLVI